MYNGGGNIEMVRSMTGYGKASVLLDTKEIEVEIKSVNHRYLDLNYRMPKYLGFVEERVRKVAGEFTTRGKLDISISILSGEESGKTITVDKDLAEQYMKALDELSAITGLEKDISLQRFISTDVLRIEHAEQDDEELWNEIYPVLKQAFENYNVLRTQEGERLKNDIIEKTDLILNYVSDIEKISPETVKEYKERLFNRVKETVDAMVEIDETRILTEVAIFTDKVCVDEEIVRLRSHVEAVRNILTEGKSAGKKLDFIIQEMNREINTIGSKANELKIAEIVIEVKTIIEKIREQIQNIE